MLELKQMGCNVVISDATEYCPLCHAVLEKENPNEIGKITYPNVYAINKKLSIVRRLLIFLWVAFTGLGVFFNYQYTPDFYWSAILSAGLLYAVIVVDVMLNRDAGYLKKIFSTVVGGVFMVILIDYVLGFNRWSLNFVLPGAIFLVNIALIVLMIVNNRNFQSYMILEILMILIGIIPVIFVCNGIVKYPLISEMAFASSVILFLGTLILGGRTARTEMRRRFHV